MNKMSYNELLVNIITKNTTHGLSELELDILLRKLINSLNESEKKRIIKLLEDEDNTKGEVIYKEDSE